MVSNDWNIKTDEYNNTFIANDSIKQRIQLGKNIEHKIERVHSSANMAGYEIAENVVFSNSNKNMNISLLNFWSKDKEDIENHKDQHIIYITLVTKGYKLLDYEVIGAANIVQTYRRKDGFQGCALTFDELNQELMVLFVKDYNKNRYVQITVFVDGEGKVQIDKVLTEADEIVKDLRAVEKKLSKGKMHHFRLTFPKGYLPTATFIVDGSEGTDDKYVNKVKALTENIKNAKILVLPAGDSTFESGTDEEKEALDNMFKKYIVDERVRAVTLVNCKLPYDFCKKYKVLYLFSMDENGEVNCIRSN